MALPTPAVLPPTVETSQERATVAAVGVETATTAPTDAPTVEAQYIPPEGFIPTPVPILYKMFDWGTDLQKLHPEYGPVGSIQFALWEDINPARGAYDWGAIDRQLAKEAELKVTLPDGREIPKPVVIQIMAHLSSAPNWEATFYDASPGWVYDEINAQNPGDPRPIIGGQKVGHVLRGCGEKAVVPAYDEATWREAYFDMVRAFGARYNANPQVTAIVVNTGLDGETQAVKDWYCDWNSALDEQASAVRYRFGQFMLDCMDVYRESFPNKYIYVNNAPGGSGVRKTTSDYAASVDPPVGLKHSGMWIDLDSHQGYGSFYGSWDLIRQYSMTLPIWLESPFGLGSSEHRYWALVAGLHYHPDAIDLHPEFFPQSDPAWLQFTAAHLGVNIHDTPSVWTVLRDAEYPLVSWGKNGVSGHMGDWTFWLYRRENAPQSATLRMWRDELPVAQDHVFSRQTRRTQQDSDQIYMSFDIDDASPYVAQKPAAIEGGTVSYQIEVTILNTGSDTFALQYLNWDGVEMSQTRRKGPSLGMRDDWVTVVFDVTDAYLDNNMPGDTDFRISCERDGDEYIHKVLVRGLTSGTPTSTATRLPTPTPTPTATSPPGPTHTATATLEPISPHDPEATILHPASDTFLDEWSPGSSLNTSPQLKLRQGNVRVPLLRFDLTSLPSGAEISSAKLHVYAHQRSNDAYMNVSAHKVLRAWDETTANWTHANSYTRWTVPGCSDPLRDVSMVAVDWTEMRQQSRWFGLDITSMAREWLVDSSANRGVLLRCTADASVEYSFWSAEYPDAQVRPRLEIVWQGGATPQASSTPWPSDVSTSVPTDQPSATPSLTATPSPTATPTMTLDAGPHTVSFRQGVGYWGVTDTHLDGWAPDEANYRAIKLGARQGGIRAPLVRFDLSSIPVGSSVRRATLRIYATDSTDASSLSLLAHRVMRPWSLRDATWTKATATEAWAQAGARDAGLDRSAQVYASSAFQKERTWIEWNLAALVQEWVAQPDTNYGLLLEAEGGVSMQVNLASSEWAMVDFRPELEVEFSTDSPTSTPPASETPVATETLAPTATLSPTPLPVSGAHTFQQGHEGYQGCRDTYIDLWYPNRAFGDEDKLSVRQGGVRSLLMRWDLSPIPPGSQINDAQLHLYQQYRSGPSPLTVQVNGMLRPWVEGEATHQRASRLEPWSVEGIGGVGTDFDKTIIATAQLSGQGKWVTFDLTHVAQRWLDHPAQNHGLVIKAEGGISVQYDFTSSEWAPVPGLRPRLVVAWDPPGGPIPTTPAPTPIPASPTPMATESAESTATAATPTAEDTPDPMSTPESTRIVLQQGLDDYYGVRDTYLDGWAQTTNRGASGTMNVRQGGVRVGLLRFDLADLPRNAEVEAAKLSLWVAYASNPGQVSLEAYTMQQEWSEEEATWLGPVKGTSWSQPGAAEPSHDYAPTSVGDTIVRGAKKWVTLDVTSAAQQWIDDPTRNHGLLLRSSGSVYVEHQFASSQWVDEELRPKLLIRYNPRSGTLGIRPGADDLVPWTMVIGGGIALLLVLLFGPRRGRRPR